MIGRHKRNKAEEGLETSLNLANFSRFSVGCDYSGPLTLRLSRENNQEDSPQHHVPKHQEMSSREKGKTTSREKGKTTSLRDNLRLLEEKLAKASGQLKTAKIVRTVKKEQRSQMRQTFAAGRQPPFRLEICQQINESGSTLNLESQTKLQKMVGASKKGKDYFLGTMMKAVSGLSSASKNYLNRTIAHMRGALSLDHPSIFELQHRKVSLEVRPKYLGCKTLLVELDHAFLVWKTQRTSPQDLQVGSGTQHGFISLRPYTLSFLRRIASSFEIIVFSKMEKQRLDLIIEELDPEGRLISGSLSLECCTLRQGDKISKDLRILNRDLRDTVILECEVASVVQVNNVVPVVPVWGEEDKELMELERFLLREVARCGDVRDLCRGWFRLQKYWQFESGEELVQELYL